MNADPLVVIQEDIFSEAASRFVRACSDSVLDREIFQIALSGGLTPKALYKALAKPPYIDAVDWESVEVFFGDERNVAPDHNDSNYLMARRTILDHVPLVASQIHRMPCEGHDLPHAAVAYESLLRKRLIPDESNVKALDLVLLGLGEDGHTASLFPDSPALDETEKWVAPNLNAATGEERLTLTYPAINTARNVWFLVTGKDKAGIVAAVLSGKGDAYPASRVDPESGELVWLLDGEAASEIPPGLLEKLT